MEGMASIYADRVIDEFIDDFMVGLIDLAHREGKVSKGMPKTKITFSPDTPSFLHELNDLSNTGYLTIEMKNGKRYRYIDKEFDDYEMKDSWLLVKNKDKTVGAYAVSDISWYRYEAPKAKKNRR